MTYDQRVAAYRRDNRQQEFKPTPAQRRRLIKKMRHAK